MDCMNSLGEVISIEDVDDIGGSCMTYIRVSVHEIFLGNGTGVGAVAVGDTFLFSVAKKLIADQSTTSLLNLQDHTPTPLQQLCLSMLSDSICLTHILPYYRCLLGVGDEDQSTERFLSCLRDPYM